MPLPRKPRRRRAPLLRQQQAEASLVLAWSDDCSRYGRVALDEEERAVPG